VNDLFEGPAVSDQPEDERQLSRAEKRALREARRRAAKRRRRALVAVVVALAVLGVGGYLAWNRGADFFGGLSLGGSEAAQDFPGPGTGEVRVTVAQGATGTAIGQELVEANVVASVPAFITAFNANPSSGSIQPGTYTLREEMSSTRAVEFLLDTGNRTDFLVDQRPGTRVEDTIARIVSVTGVPEDELRAAMVDVAATGLPAEAQVFPADDLRNYEGWLASKQYQFSDDATPTEMIAEMVAGTVTTLDELGVPTEDRQRVLTEASIVQSEAGNLDGEQQALVAGVIEGRIADEQRLQMDSTIHYQFGTSPDASTTTEQRETVGPYNTYLNTGLPPTAISTPSRTSIEAVISAPSTDNRYFVTVNPDTGETKFAVTYEEHQVNVEEYREWLRSRG
jgi:UPF0755 protein